MDIVCNINYNIVTHIIRLILQVILPAEQVRQAELVCLGVDNCWCWDSFWVQNFLQGRCSTSQGLGPSAAGCGRGRSAWLRACPGRCPGRHWQGPAFTGSGKDHDPISRARSSKPVQSSTKILELRVRRSRRPGRLPRPPVCLPACPDSPARGTVSSRLRVGTGLQI